MEQNRTESSDYLADTSQTEREVRDCAPVRKRGWIFLLPLILIIVDQCIKFAVKTHMVLGETIRITDWFYIHFTENAGMAFGWDFMNKYLLTILRILASIFLFFLICKLLKEKVKPYKTGFLLALSAVLAGAVGNIIDSVFYGRIFSDSHGKLAELFPSSGGYAPLLQGKVVDMFYFPIIDSYWPRWMPFVGGEHFIFFSPIFNFADACISVSAFVLILFYYKSFSRVWTREDVQAKS